MTTEMQEIRIALLGIRNEIRQLRASLSDKDMFLTAEESDLLDQSYVNETDGNVLSSVELRQSLGT